MNTKLITILTLGALPLVGAAMPTKAELDKVSPVVMDLMRPDQEALKAGKKTKSEVAAAALDLVAKADGEAAKLLLTKGAYNLYVRDGDFEKAIETLKSFREIVPDMEPQYLANIIESSLRTISRKNGGQLYQLLDETRTLARFRDELKKLEAQAKKDATDKTLQLKLAEHYAVLGDWPKALDAFAKSSDRKAAEAAKAETVDATPPVDAASSPRQKENNPSVKSAADYWWNYSTRKAPEFEKPFRQHAAQLYEKAIASGELVGLNKVQADRRIEEANALGETVYEAPATKDGLYCVIDLSGGPNAKRYPVSYLNAAPKGGWSDEYKTTKLVLRRIEPGSFEPAPGKKFDVKQAFYVGVFEVTCSQYNLIAGDAKCDATTMTHPVKSPVKRITYQLIRGKNEGLKWPKSNKVDETSIAGKLRARTGLTFDLPTERQWEYACRGGTTSAYNDGSSNDASLKKLGRFVGNCAKDATTTVVGSYAPNKFGLYDMHGNVWEFCVNRHPDTSSHWGRNYIALDECYEGPLYVLRGGSYAVSARECSSSMRLIDNMQHEYWGYGFRLAIQPPFVPPKAMVGAAQSPDANLAKAKREMEEKIAAQHEDKLYCVIDLSGGPNAKHYPVSYLNSAPKTGWSDEYKTTKLVLRKINPGKFEYMAGKQFSLTKSFYMAVFEVTQRQYELISGRNPSEYQGEKQYGFHPVEGVTYAALRGGKKGLSWPTSSDVDEGSFLGLLRIRTKLDFDLPTEAQWEYACRASKTSRFNNGGDDASDVIKLGCCADNGGKTSRHVKVGAYIPNAWGLYDMHGNVWEWCLDRNDEKVAWKWIGWSDCSQNSIDPLGQKDGTARAVRGGCWWYGASACASSCRMFIIADQSTGYTGLRLAIQPK